MRGHDGHDDLANPGFVHALEQLEELDLPRRRQGRFRLVEDEYALPLASLIEEPQKTLAVRMRKKIQRLRAGIERGCVEVTRHGKEAFGAEEPAIGDLRQPGRAQRLGQRTAHRFQGGMIDRPITLAAARFIVSGKCRNSFEQRRFPGAVFTDE